MNNSVNSKPGLISRQAAWEVLQAVSAGVFADVALERAINRHSLNIIDSALVTELAYGAIRQRYLLDCWIDFVGKIPACKQPPLLRWLLHIGLYQILKMKKIPYSAAINTSVELAKKSKFSRLSPVVNGILRSALRLKEKGKNLPIPENKLLRIAQNESLPAWLVGDLIKWRNDKDVEQIAKTFNFVPKLDLRVNLNRGDIEDLKKKFDEVGIETRSIENCPQGIEVISGEGALSEWPGYKSGKWCVQDRSSQLIAPLLDPKPGERVLDACAAPGGKTTHIAELIRDEGELWAVDRSKKRLDRLLDNSNRLGCKCIRPLVADSSKLLDIRPDWKGYFHKILLDAPCSGLGTLARHPDARWRMTPEKIKELVFLQYELLSGLAILLKPGGRLIYSTCTIHPDENHHQVSHFVKKYSQYTVKYEKQIWPLNIDSGDGFYVAILDSEETYL